jgi:TolB-like protein/Flp pilus assembly protein TadD
MPLAPSTRLGPYEIVSLIGAGGMGEVYRARDTRLQRDLAVKVLPPEMAADAERLRRFEQEALALAAIEHPNIVTVYSVEEIGGVRFIAMELVRGRPLSEVIPGGGLPAEKLLGLAVQMADALAAAHRQGVTHRDLKPANIMVGEDGRLKILDFGLAKLRRGEAGSDAGQPQPLCHSETLTQERQILGTVPYMSPEQIEGRPLDPRSDLFSLGIILYEMATGQRPFSGNSWASLASSILRDTPASLSERRPDLPGDLGRIVSRCLQKDVGLRFQTAADLRNELDELRGLVASSKAVPTPPTRTSPATRMAAATRSWPRWAWWLAAGGAALVLAALAAFFLIWPARRAAALPPKIVVLPFENLGPQDDAYFAGGMTEEITSRLAAVRGLAVVSSTSARQYERKGKTIKNIGQDLGVNFVLDGSVRWERSAGGPSRVRITPQLIRVADDTQVWAQPFERDSEDVFAVQSEIAETVAQRMGVMLTEEGRKTLSSRSTDNLEAYQAYLRGRYYVAQPHFSEDNWRHAQESFARAVELDPRFVLAYAELAKVHAKLYYFRADLSEERRTLAREAVDQARRLAPDAAEAHLAAGFYHFWVERNAPAALQEFDVAARRLSDSAEVLDARAEALRMTGHWQEALQGYRRALELNPGDPDITEEISITYWWLRSYPEALDYANRAIALAPDQAWPYLAKAFNYWSWKGGCREARTALGFVSSDHEWWLWAWFWEEMIEGNYRDALARLEAAPGEWIRQKMWAMPKALLAGYAHLSLSDPKAARAAFDSARTLLEAELAKYPDDPRYHSSLGIAYAALGRKNEALREGHRATELLPLEKDAVYGFSHLHDLAVIYAMAGEKAAALGQIEHMLSIPSFISPVWLRINPQWASLWNDARFKALLRKYK